MGEQNQRTLPTNALDLPAWSGSISLAIAVVTLATYAEDEREDLKLDAEHAAAARVEQIEAAEWRNAFWRDLDSNAATRDPNLAKDIRRLFLDEERPDADEMNAIVRHLHAKTTRNSYGILDANGGFTDVSLTQIDRIRSREGLSPEPVLEPLDLVEFTLWATFAKLFGWPVWFAIWGCLAAILQACHGNKHSDGYQTWSRGPWLGIDRTRGAYGLRATIALLYAPTLLAVAIALTLWHGTALAFSLLRHARVWLKDLRNPYRAEIRIASRALAALRRNGAEPALVKSAEEMVELWQTRHKHETTAAADEAATSARNARIQAARDALIGLDAAAEVDGIKGRSAKSATRTTSTGS